MTRFFAKALLYVFYFNVAIGLGADEGQWTLNNLPKQAIKTKYGFEITDAWLEHVQKSVVRFPGGTGSFVSSSGLIMTNHHIASDCLETLSTEKNNYYENGFLARTRSQELRCVGTNILVLMSAEDVTQRVSAAVTPAMSPEDASAARTAQVAVIQKEANEETGLEPEVIALYQGGQYYLYLYKKYDDVRLVFAPEVSIASFGGDPDNFEYPRYDLDLAFMRAYENGKPVRTEHFLRWSKEGAKEDEPIFVFGHPGRTDRARTVADLTFHRDVASPFVLDYLYHMEIAYQQFGFDGKEQKRITKVPLFMIQNSRKAYVGRLRALRNHEFFARKVSEEKTERAYVASDPGRQAAYGSAWDDLASARASQANFYTLAWLIDGGRAFSSELFYRARAIVRQADERELLEPLALNRNFEETKLTASLSFLAANIGFDKPIVQKVLAGKCPEVRAHEIVFGTKVDDPAFVKSLIAGGLPAVQASNDPMIQLVLTIELDASEMRKKIMAVQEIERQAYAKIARVRWEMYGTDTYPDATFTLRMSFGTVKGYEENGKNIPHQTTFGGLFERAKEYDNESPWKLPRRWTKKGGSLDLSTPFNFVANVDIVGGNSGSPGVNKNGEVVGLIFDGNIQSLAWGIFYTEEHARGVLVHSLGITEALKKVYKAKFLIDELGK